MTPTTGLYARQAPLNLDTWKFPLIAGAGGTGFWTALAMAMAGITEMIVCDPDDLEESNLARLPYSPEDIGKNKAAALAEFLLNIRPTLNITIQGEVNEFLLETLRPGFTEIIDCTDSLAAQKEIYTWAKKAKKTYYRVGCDGHHITNTPHQSFFGVDGGQQGYTVVPAWVGAPMVAGALAASRFLTGQPKEAILDIREIGRQAQETVIEEENLPDLPFVTPLEQRGTLTFDELDRVPARTTGNPIYYLEPTWGTHETRIGGTANG